MDSDDSADTLMRKKLGLPPVKVRNFTPEEKERMRHADLEIAKLERLRLEQLQRQKIEREERERVERERLIRAKLERERLEQAERERISKSERDPPKIKICSLKDHLKEIAIISGRGKIVRWKMAEQMVVDFEDDTGWTRVFVNDGKHQVKLMGLKTGSITIKGRVLDANNILLTDIISKM